MQFDQTLWIYRSPHWYMSWLKYLTVAHLLIYLHESQIAPFLNQTKSDPYSQVTEEDMAVINHLWTGPSEVGMLSHDPEVTRGGACAWGWEKKTTGTECVVRDSGTVLPCVGWRRSAQVMVGSRSNEISWDSFTFRTLPGKRSSWREYFAAFYLSWDYRTSSWGPLMGMDVILLAIDLLEDIKKVRGPEVKFCEIVAS